MTTNGRLAQDEIIKLSLGILFALILFALLSFFLYYYCKRNNQKYGHPIPIFDRRRRPSATHRHHSHLNKHSKDYSSSKKSQQSNTLVKWKKFERLDAARLSNSVPSTIYRSKEKYQSIPYYSSNHEMIQINNQKRMSKTQMKIAWKKQNDQRQQYHKSLPPRTLEKKEITFYDNRAYKRTPDSSKRSSVSTNQSNVYCYNVPEGRILQPHEQPTTFIDYDMESDETYRAYPTKLVSQNGYI
ncbi:hypothetical protein SNEBB_008477 [Seison nebaliae]|nr:hypothetical protein SNEBB_008477 [Seison nebaliae]